MKGYEMTSISKEKLLKIVDETIARSSDLADAWTGTQFEKQIDLQQAQVIKAVERNDYTRAEALVLQLSKLLNYAENEYERVEV